MGNVNTYSIDSATELSELPNTNSNPPIAFGSVANSINEGVSFILNSSNEWVEQDSFVNYSEVF